MSTINFKSKLYKIGSWTILNLSKNASAKLPSRGMTMIEGTINGFSFKSPLEPDGKGSHWLKIDKKMCEAIRADEGDTVTLKIKSIKEWPEPQVPSDLNKALLNSPQIHKLWIDITPVARWDWIRWINATKNSQTRRIRIEKALSKLKAGKRAACCFNRSQCTETYVSNNGVLLEPNQTTVAKEKMNETNRAIK